MQSYVNFNGSLLEADSSLIPAQNRGLRYGDGLFETIKVINGQIVLGRLHFERLFSGLKTLLFDIPSWLTPSFLEDRILELCRKNSVERAGRIRLNLFRGNGSLYDLADPRPQYIIEAAPLAVSQLQLNESDWAVGLYTAARKSCDAFSHLKSNNYLPYVMAAFYARQHGLQDCFLLNTSERICDATIANVFWVMGDTIFTPPLSEGGVGGIMRQYLITELPSAGFCVKEQTCNLSDLQQAEEIFLTNAIYGIRSVKSFGSRSYRNNLTVRLFDLFVSKLNG